MKKNLPGFLLFFFFAVFAIIAFIINQKQEVTIANNGPEVFKPDSMGLNLTMLEPTYENSSI